MRIKNITKNKNKIDFGKKYIIGKAEIDLNKMIVILNKQEKVNNSEKVLIEMLSNPEKLF